MAKLLSIQVGMPVDGSAYRKSPVAGPVMVGHERIEGDDQGSKKYHGGPDRAVLAYAVAHYPLWQAEFPQHGWHHGAFAENFTVEGLDEETVCIGDRHTYGEAVLEVSCPRSPCMKIEQNNGLPGLFMRVRETGRIGWLYRVVRQGAASTGEILVERGAYPQWTVARTMDAFTRGRAGDEVGRELLACDALVQSWRDVLHGVFK